MSAHGSDHQRVEVDNFGPIAKADIELRPLTVFVGASNSGKSYLAKLIYALHRYFSLHLAFRHKSWKATRFHKVARQIHDLPGVVEWLEERLAGEPASIDVPYPPEVLQLAREAVKGVDTGTALDLELRRIFGVETIQPLVLSTSPSARIGLNYSPPGSPIDPPSFRYAFKLIDDKLKWRLDVEDDAPMRLERSGTFWRRGLVPNFFQRRNPEQSIDGSPINPMALQHVLADLAQPSTVGSLSKGAHYLPASRSGGMETQQLLLRGSLRDMTAGPRRSSTAPPLSGVLADYIESTLIDLPVKPTDWGPGTHLASEIERTLLGGSVRVEEPENGSPRVFFRPVGWEEDLPLARASSMVTELIPVAVYLRHHVRAGETIIIEEPEAHMHPAMQVQLAVALAKIVTAGIRVIITVHSDWILSALANICRMAELPQQDRGDIAGGDVTLPASQVGVWEFLPKDERVGTETREIVLDSDNGMYDAGYPRAAQALYDDWATIHSRLQED